jgi:hypothetical protein
MILSIYCRYAQPTWEVLTLGCTELVLALWPLSFFSGRTMRRACVTLCLWSWCAVVYVVSLCPLTFSSILI